MSESGDHYIDTGPGQVPEEVNSSGQVIAIGVPAGSAAANEAPHAAPLPGGTAPAASTPASTPAGSGTVTTPATGTGGSGTAAGDATLTAAITPVATTGITLNDLDPFTYIDGALQNLLGPLGSAGDLLTSVTDIARTFRDLGVAISELIDALEWLFVPSHWVRMSAFLGGAIMIVPGLYALLHTGQGGVGDVHLALGILLTVMAGVLFFIAFHNLPDSVTDFQDLLSWMAEGLRTGKAPTS